PGAIFSALPGEGRSASEQPAIDEEAGAFRNLVVELHRGRVRLVGLPVDARRAGLAGALVDALDEGAAHARAARRRIREQVLQIAARRNRRRAAMEQIMGKPEEP